MYRLRFVTFLTLADLLPMPRAHAIALSCTAPPSRRTGQVALTGLAPLNSVRSMPVTKCARKSGVQCRLLTFSWLTALRCLRLAPFWHYVPRCVTCGPLDWNSQVTANGKVFCHLPLGANVAEAVAPSSWMIIGWNERQSL